uniref:Uncharacterized protein n=1 Tax=Neogobius melanostomus TaxID=47308 RepID=A0A8C6SK07_9GOBI
GLVLKGVVDKRPTHESDMVLFSNFSSPEYIIDLKCAGLWRGLRLQLVVRTVIWTDSWLLCPGSHVGFHNVSGCCFSPWRPKSPSRGISLIARHRRRSTPPGPRWWPRARTPSLLREWEKE